jgi:hypothetical protein
MSTGGLIIKYNNQAIPANKKSLSRATALVIEANERGIGEVIPFRPRRDDAA